MNLEVKKASKADVELLQMISRKVIDQNYRCFLGAGTVDYFINSGINDSYIVENIKDTFLLILNGEIVGMCVFR